MQSQRYWKSLLKSLTPSQIQTIINELTDEEAEQILFDWDLWARADQLEPAGNWQYWLILAGRGWGKTRTGAEWVKKQVKKYPIVNLIGATADDARDIMVQGESGILTSCSHAERPIYKKSQRCLEWPNGAKSLIFTADEPERLRGKQHICLWADELAAWRYSEAWDQAMFGLRLGDNPRAIITTTPRPTQLIKDLIKNPATHVSRGTTYDNKLNLAPSFFAQILKTYEGTRLGRQELNAELLEDNPHALWQRTIIDGYRVFNAPPTLKRIVIGVDPAVTSNENSDETGIIVAAIADDNHCYVLSDLSLIDTPDGWTKQIIHAYHLFMADKIIGEINNGGDLVESLIRKQPNGQMINFKAVRASKAKTIRAEPVAALYEQGRVHHVGCFPKLEDQMCEYDPINTAQSPDRMDALVWAITELFSGSGLAFATV